MTLLRQETTFTPGAAVGDPLAEAWLRQATLRLRREVAWRWHQRGVSEPDAGALPPSDAGSRLRESLDNTRYFNAKRAFFERDATAAYLSEKIGDAPGGPDHAPPRGSFSWLVDALALDDVAAFALALGLLVRFDAAAGPVVAACQADSTRTNPSLALVQQLWDEPEQCLSLADPAHPLWRFGLLQRPRADGGSDWDAPYTVAPLVAERLLSGRPSTRLVPLPAHDYDPDGDAAPLIDRLRAPAQGLRVVPLKGRLGTPYRAVAGALADAAGHGADTAAAGAGDASSDLLTLAWLDGVDLLLEPTGSLANHDGITSQLASLRSLPITVFLASPAGTDVPSLPADILLPPYVVPALPFADRVERFRRGLGVKVAGLEGEIAEAARRFRFEAETIDAVCEGLRMHSGALTEHDLFAACRAAVPMDTGEMAKPVTPRFRPDELVLPPAQQRQFEEVVRAMRSLTKVHYGWNTARAWNESGISVLFAGASGTGKTMAAEVLSARLDIPMYRINLSQVVNKYIGETEKNLERVFDAADATETLLFFDEADALFGRRTDVKDAHDRYANLEVSYLLERMERFKGLAVLATNRRGDMDEAFLRRLRYIIEFPLPEAPQRLEIWRRVIPDAVDTSDLDFDFLAGQFQLAGGNIRSAAFNACLQVAGSAQQDEGKPRLTMDEVIVAVKREYDKLQRTVSLEQFGPYAPLVESVSNG